jgi:tRNA threonylcarbamoyladenosine biosynthesis protein TsaE
MTHAAQHSYKIQLTLPTEEATTHIASRISEMLTIGDTLLISGPIGAGKTHFCRSLIQSRLRSEGRMEEVPSPTFTLVQIYDLNNVEIWHADLYRVMNPDDVMELGLGDAFETAICLVEWPDRLGTEQPRNAMSLEIAAGNGENSRVATFSASSPRWAPVFALLTTIQANLE